MRWKKTSRKKNRLGEHAIGFSMVSTKSSHLEILAFFVDTDPSSWVKNLHNPT
jgi:hypothetical protein